MDEKDVLEVELKWIDEIKCLFRKTEKNPLTFVTKCRNYMLLNLICSLLSIKIRELG